MEQTIIAIITSRVSFEVGGVLAAVVDVFGVLCRELGDGYVRSIILLKMVAATGMKIDTLVEEGECVLLRGKFEALARVLGGEDRDVVATVIGKGFTSEPNQETLTFDVLPRQIVTTRSNYGRTVSVKACEEGAMRVGDVILKVTEGGGATVKRYRVPQGVRDDVVSVLLEVVMKHLEVGTMKNVLRRIIEGVACATLPLDWAGVVGGLGRMCAGGTALLKEAYMQVSKRAANNGRVKTRREKRPLGTNGNGSEKNAPPQLVSLSLRSLEGPVRRFHARRRSREGLRGRFARRREQPRSPGFDQRERGTGAAQLGA